MPQPPEPARWERGDRVRVVSGPDAGSNATVVSKGVGYTTIRIEVAEGGHLERTVLDDALGPDDDG